MKFIGYITDKNYNRIGYKKWDKYMERWEVYDKNGKRTMYYKWNKYMDRWDYYEY